jgi:hypothetical protein
MRILLVAVAVLCSCGRAPADQFVDGVLPIHVVPPPPLKLVIALSATQSFAVTDPNGQRGSAITALLATLPAGTSVLPVAFAGTAVAFVTPTGQPAFAPVSSLTMSDRSLLVQRMTLFVAPGTMTDTTDFATALRTIRDAITVDLQLPASSRYEVIFIADGGPSTDQDQELLCRSLVRELASLSLAPNDVRVNTVFINQVQVPSCADPITESACSIQPAASRCPASVRAADEARLRRMAELGHGTFKSYRAGATVDYAPLLVH